MFEQGVGDLVSFLEEHGPFRVAQSDGTVFDTQLDGGSVVVTTHDDPSAAAVGTGVLVAAAVSLALLGLVDQWYATVAQIVVLAAAVLAVRGRGTPSPGTDNTAVIADDDGVRNRNDDAEWVRWQDVDVIASSPYLGAHAVWVTPRGDAPFVWTVLPTAPEAGDLADALRRTARSRTGTDPTP